MSMAYGARSHSENMGNTSYGEGSHAEGEYTVALGDYSHVEGSSTLAQNAHEHAQGRYNVSNQTNTTFGDAGNTIHSIGIGTGTSARKNAVEVMQNGDTYIYGIGSYDGTNYVNAETLQDVIQNSSPGTLDTTYTTSQTTSNSESLSGNIRLHKIAKTGSNDDLLNAPWKFDETGSSSTKKNIFVPGRSGTTYGYHSTSEGYNCDTGGTATTNAKGINQSNIMGRCAHAEGNSTIAQGQDTHSEGIKTFAVGSASHAEGGYTEARGYGSIYYFWQCWEHASFYWYRNGR